MENNNYSKVTRVYTKVERIKKFYWFLVTSVLGSLFMVGAAAFLYANKMPYSEVPITICLATPLVFGVAVIFEYLKVFDRNFIFGKNWENNKIREFIEKDRQEAEKYE